MNINFIFLIRRLIYSIFLFKDKYISKKFNYLFVLCYHSISNDNWRFSVSTSDFKNQIEYLYKRYKFIGATDLYNHMIGNKLILEPSLVLCFDDGYKDVLLVKELLKLYKVKPLLFVLSDSNNIDRNELGTNKPLLNEFEIQELINDGWEIGSHGATHKNFNKLDSKKIEEEIVESKMELEKKLGIKIKYFSFPKGIYSKSILERVKNAGYAMSFTMDDYLIDNRNIFTIPRTGIDKTHSFSEFQAAFSPTTIRFRGFIKKLLWKNNY